MKSKIISVLLVLIIVLSTLTACGGNDNPNDNQGIVEKDNIAEDYDRFPTKLSAEKIGSIKVDNISSYRNNGLIYKSSDGKYGIISSNGEKDSGAKYTYCEYAQSISADMGEKVGAFIVSTANSADVSNPASLNCMGLVDSYGKEIIPEKYAVIKILNERFAQVYEVTESVNSKDEALVYYSSSDKFISFQPGQDDPLFKGVWYIYDVTTCQQVKDVTATNSYTLYTYGNCLKYYTDAKEEIIVNYEGKRIPDGAQMLKNGYYSLKSNEENAVYDYDNKKLFTYDENGFVPFGVQGNYIVASKTIDKTKTSVLMDYSGEIVSAEFMSEYTDSLSLYGDLVFVGDKLYKLNGELVIDGTYESVKLDNQTGKAWLLQGNNNQYTLITEDGTILYQDIENDAVDIYSATDFSFSKKIDSEYFYYSFADKDYTLNGDDLSTWLVKVSEADGSYSVVDTISGDKIINGYSNYMAVNASVANTYVYAYNYNDSNMDIYLVK